MSEIVELKVPQKAAGKRLDAFLAKDPRLTGGEIYLSRSRIQHLIEAGAILVDGGVPEKSMKLKGGESIQVVVPDPQSPEDIPPEEFPLEIHYDDEHIIVVNKPAGMSTHPTAEMRTGTLINALKGLGVKLPWRFYPYRPGIVHRLDKRTSGLLVVGKTEESYLKLVDMMRTRDIHRIYYALTIGNLPGREGKLEGDIGRHPVDRKKMAVVERGGKEAGTIYTVLERYPGIDFARIKLLTGRTHQIRVHFSHVGRAVFGDDTYGGQFIKPAVSPALERMGLTRMEKDKWAAAIDKLEKIRADAEGHMLHAYKLSFRHPINVNQMEFQSELPDYFENALTLLRNMGEVPLEP